MTLQAIETAPTGKLPWSKPTYRIVEERGLSIERCRELFELDYSTGELTRRVLTGPHTRIGDKVNTIGGEGYLIVSVSGRRYLVHRIVFAMVNNRWPSDLIDHCNSVRTDNRPSNLREATTKQNTRNRLRSKANTSGYDGVSWNTRLQKWAAQIWTGKRNKCLGYFTDKADAALVIDLERLQYHGIYARLNDPNGPYMAMFDYAADLEPMSRLETPIFRQLL